MVVVIDPTSVLGWDDADKTKRGPYVVEDQTEARELIGGTGCRAVSEAEAW
jgi:glutaminase